MPNAIVFSSTTYSATVLNNNGNIYATSNTTQIVTSESVYNVNNNGNIILGYNLGYNGANVRIANGNVYAASYITQLTTGEGGYQVINRGTIVSGFNTGAGTVQPNETGTNPSIKVINVATSGEYWSIN